MIEHEISWEKCVDLCTDGSTAMTGKMSELEFCIRVGAILFKQALCAPLISTCRQNDGKGPKSSVG